MLRTLLFAVLLVALSLLLIAGCWKAGFTNYDDTHHVTDNPHLAMPAVDLLKPAPSSTYFPVTLLSYRLDQALFAGWMPARLGSWAPGVRLMTLLYHAAAAFCLSRLLLRLGLGYKAACFIALAFAVHPLACETVCWTSERKNALAGLFGFAALWAFLAGEARWWRIPLALALYVAALGGKPSALGLLPVFVLLELFGGPAFFYHEDHEVHEDHEGIDKSYSLLRVLRPLRDLRGKEVVAACARLAPLALAAGLALVLNLRGHAGTVVPPPGGTVFTALLTDLEILSRYLFNLFIPVSLSAVYLVEPVRSIWDARVLEYGLLLAALVAATTALAADRWRALFGWLWFVAALGPNLNLIAIPQAMQDRYLYLSTPGAFLVLVEVFAGLRFDSGFWNRPQMNTDRHRWKTIVSYLCSSVFICGPLAACAFLASLSLLSLQRGRVWASTLTIFEDAVRKQPRASFAYFGLGSAYGQIWENNRRNPRADQHKVEEVRQLFLQTWKNGLDRCPDAERYTIYLVMAVNVGEELCRQAGEERDAGKRQKKLQAAEYYLLKAARPPLETADSPAVRAVALTDLAALRIAQGDPGAAYRFACDAVAASDEPPARLVRARAAVSLASSLRQSGNKEPTKAQELIAQAREDASLVPAGAATYSQAQELLRDPIFKQ